MPNKKTVIKKTKNFTETDYGLTEFIENQRIYAKEFVKVGVQGNEAGIKNDGVTNIEKALQNEFGTSRIPSRPFIRETMDREKVLIDKLIATEYKKTTDGKTTVIRGLNSIGNYVQSLIVEGFTKYNWPPNAESTVREKKSSQPLIDTGNLRQSITFKVVKGNQS